MEFEDAFQVADRAVLVKTGKHLSDLQQILLEGAWNGDTYEAIGQNRGYSPRYLQRDVGPKFWRLLSEALGERVEKKNFRNALERYRRRGRAASNPAAREPEPTMGKFPDGPVALGSPFYVELDPIEARCCQEILRPGALISIRGPQHMGKTSLIQRILARARDNNCKAAYLNFRQADEAAFASLDKFLRWFCANLCLNLDLEHQIEDYWDENIGSKVSATRYLQGRLLQHFDSPLVIALDEVDRLFPYAEIAPDFLSALRSWHEEAKNLEIWKKLRLIVAHATEVYVKLDLHQSPFNVGLPVKLPEFSPEQVRNLARVYEIDWRREEAEKLMGAIGGHPYLVRLALYHISQEHKNADDLLEEAATESGIYSSYLRGHLVYLQKHPKLAAAMKRVVDAEDSVRLESMNAYQLESMGLLQLQGNNARPSCELYRQYFRDRI
ncbi:MAG: serine/threonine protein kinase [Oscillatoria sp. SIO1A7]|nr:serine/threonine protein kinase [Oscillatoria sp. SIO1A7]